MADHDDEFEFDEHMDSDEIMQEEEAEDTKYRITGEGLHAIGAINDHVYELYRQVEEERDIAWETIDELNKIIGLCYDILNVIAGGGNDPEGLASEALTWFSKVEGNIDEDEDEGEDEEA